MSLGGKLENSFIYTHSFLRVIKKLDKIYLLSMKAQDVFLYLTVVNGVFARQQFQPTLIAIPCYMCCLIAFYSFKIEDIIDAEAALRDKYYECLDWYTAPVEVQKMILIAMQPPMKISFGALYGSDQTSLVRLKELVLGAYDFGLFLVQIIGSG